MKVYESLGKQKTTEVVKEMRPVERINGDAQSAKYQILRRINGKDITFYIRFVNLFGEWRIENY
jgi:hypothetical protein